MRATGPSAEQALRLGRQYFAAHSGGLAAGVAVIGVLSLLLAPGWLAPLWRSPLRRLLDAPTRSVGFALGALAAGAAAAFSAWGLDGRPILVDGVTQLVQARYLAAGSLAGPVLEDPAFWQLQFTVLTDAGWVSQYPLGFAALLALGWRVGAAWLMGPLSLGATVFLTTLVADRLFPEDRAVARLGALLVAVSPFLAFHAGAFMSHAPAAAFLALAVYASLRAAEGTSRWGLLSGGAVGATFAVRPLVGAVAGLLAALVLRAGTPARARPPREGWLRGVSATALGALPFVAAVMAYNTAMFGSPGRFGYVAAAGPSQGLGFHVDPWGSPYGPIEAVAYTSADLLGVSLDLLQTPLPVVVVVALHLFRTERLDAGTRLAVAWSLLPVAANALYWHHDLFMGPRLLYEAAPGWCLLLAASVLGLLRTLPERNVAQGMRRLCTRTGVAATLVLALGVGLVVAGPQKLKGYAALARTSGMAREAPETQGPSLVFVHEDWHSRLGARMSALGVRLDSIRVTLSQAPTCGVEAWVRARESGAPDPVPLAELVRLGGAAPGLREVVMPSGSRVRTYEGEVLSPECEREAASDFGGVLPLAPFLWQGDLPGLGAGGAMFVRDLGPERNVRLLELFPDRRPMLLAPSAPDGLRLVPYESGIAGMWAAP